MYNRYIRNDQGVYTRIPEDDPSPRAGPAPPPPDGARPEDPTEPRQPPREDPPETGDGLSGTLRHLLDQFRLGDLDTGDLLLLAILYFLFREGADEELLAALGLLLIL